MELSDNLKMNLKYRLGFLPFISKFIFSDADAIFDKLKTDGMIEHLKSLTPAERRTWYLSFGMKIRNDFLLWHPNNPYTMNKIEGLPHCRQDSSKYHPDNYSWDILRRLVVASGITDAQTSSAFNTSESLLYSLMTRNDDFEDTLDSIRNEIRELVVNNRFDIIDEVFAEAIAYALSPAKLKALLDGIASHATDITPINYLRVATKSISHGIKIH